MLTKEHIFPEWMQKYVVVPHGYTDHFVSRDGRLPPLGVVEKHRREGRKHRPGTPMQHRLRVVCRACNTGWMSQLQEQAIPLLTPLLMGGALELTPVAQATVAAWAVMTEMVGQFTEPRMVSISSAERAAFAATRVPDAISQWRVWIGRVTGELGASWERYTFAMHPPNAPASPPVNTQITTLTVGQALVHTFSTTATNDVTDEDFGMPAILAGLTKVWPVRDAIVTVPLQRLTPSQTLFVARHTRDEIYRYGPRADPRGDVRPAD
jgi:hypothetical protein